MKWLAIANPAAGRSNEARRALHRLAKSIGLRHEVVHTEAPGHATDLARLARDFDGLIAVGGDGTIGEILHGMDLQRQRLAVMPTGHGNCLARDLGVGNAGVAITSLQRNTCRQVDLMDVLVGFADGREERRLCASTLAVGYVTQVVQLGRYRLHGLGRAAYAAAAMLVIPGRFDVSPGDEGETAPARRLTGVVINNTMHLANFRGFPDACVDDGLMDIMEQDFLWPRQLLHNLSVLLGSRAFGPRCMRQAAVEQIVLEQPHTLMADGELLHDVTRLSVACRPAAVSCVFAPK